MRTPPLRRRVTSMGVGVVAVVVVAFGSLLYASLSRHLHSALDEVLAARLDLATAVASSAPADDLGARLSTAGIPAVVRMRDGTRIVSEPATRQLGPAPPSTVAGDPSRQMSRSTTLADGTTVEVFATTAGVDATLRRLLLVEVVLSCAAIGVAAILLARAADRAISPLSQIVETAERAAIGAAGERLRPDRPGTELGRMATAFDRMLDRQEAALAASQAAEDGSARFLADAAHQLRTPIAATRASVESLLIESDPEVRDRLFTNVVRESARASRVLGELLFIARLDKGRPPERTEVDVAEICRGEIDRTQSLAPGLDTSFEVDRRTTEAPPEVLVRAAGEELQEAIANMLDNARRHATNEIRLSLVDHDDWIEIDVTDDGDGVIEGAEELVFERFATLDGRGGSGLGLPIAREIALRHGGSLRYDRERGFVMVLPRGAQDG